MGTYLLGFPKYMLRSLMRTRRNVLYDWIQVISPKAVQRQVTKEIPHDVDWVNVGDERVRIDMSNLPKVDPFKRAKPVFSTVWMLMKTLFKQAGARLSVVYIPSGLRLFTGPWHEPPPLRDAAQGCTEFVHAACSAASIPMRDATPALQAALDQGGLIVNPVYDIHVNEQRMRILDRMTPPQSKGKRFSLGLREGALY